MTSDTHIDELDRLRQRVKKLSHEKSHLQLLSDLLTSLAHVSGIQGTLRHSIQMIMEAIGGSYMIIYYKVENQWRTYDMFGKEDGVDEIKDELVIRTISEGGMIEVEEKSEAAVHQNQPLAIVTWVFPLKVGQQVFGAFKIEGIRIALAQSVMYQLQVFINYIALTLNSEIVTFSKLKVAYDDLRIKNLELEKENAERLRAEKELKRYRDRLEDLVMEKVAELKTANEKLHMEIAERERAEAQLRKYAETQEVLVREVNHRVKNNLSALIGMLHMEEDRAESLGMSSYLPVLRDLVSRIEGLATVHSLLSASGWRPLELSELCRLVVDSALKGVPLEKRIHVEIEPSTATVSSNQAHHLTLVLNELATNSAKYALAERDKAFISIGIRQADGMIKLVFKDDGPGYPEKVLQGNYDGDSIGFELIRGIIERSMGSRISFQNDRGALTTIYFESEA